MSDAPSYHDLHVTTAQIPRTSIFSLYYGLQVTCARTAGWELRDQRGDGRLVAGEFASPEEWLVLDVDGHVIVDSRREVVPCPGGCSCRIGTEDADRYECGCDGGCRD